MMNAIEKMRQIVHFPFHFIRFAMNLNTSSSSGNNMFKKSELTDAVTKLFDNKGFVPQL